MSNAIVAGFMILGAYALGSIPWGFIIGRFYGVDVRTVGSKNIGATNVTRTVGKLPGKLCFILDFLKGGLPVLAAQYVTASMNCSSAWLVIAVMFAAILGHIFPVFLSRCNPGQKGSVTVIVLRGCSVCYFLPSIQ